MKDSTRLMILLEKYLTNEASEEEIKEVDAWYASFDTLPGLPAEELKPREIKIEKSILQKRFS